MAPNVPLLRQTLAHIEANPETWDQARYRRATDCGTAYCFAGWAAELSGVKWTTPADDFFAGFVLDGDAGETCVDEVAARLLGIEHTRDDFEDIPLFDGGNTLDDLRRIVDELCAEGEVTTGSALPEPHEIAEHLIRRRVDEINKGNARMYVMGLHQKAGIKGLPDEALVTTVHDLIRTAAITWPEVSQ